MSIKHYTYWEGDAEHGVRQTGVAFYSDHTGAELDPNDLYDYDGLCNEEELIGILKIAPLDSDEISEGVCPICGEPLAGYECLKQEGTTYHSDCLMDSLEEYRISDIEALRRYDEDAYVIYYF